MARVFPTPLLDPYTTTAASGMAPPAVGETPWPPSVRTDDETAPATTEAGGTAEIGASLRQSAAPTAVDAAAPAKSVAVLCGGDTIDEDDAPLPRPKKARIERRPHLSYFGSASELSIDEIFRRLRACRVNYALASGRSTPPSPLRWSDRCVP